MAQVQRTALNSEYDHVAMVIKYPLYDKDEIYLIESVGGPGVRLNKWSWLRSNVGPYKFYEKIALRHVKFNRTFQKMRFNLDKFVEQSMGK